MDGEVCTMTMTEYEIKSKTKRLRSYEDNPEYIEYVKLLKEYFEIKNDDKKLEQKFSEITTKHQQLVRIGIIKL